MSKPEQDHIVRLLLRAGEVPARGDQGPGAGEPGQRVASPWPPVSPPTSVSQRRPKVSRQEVSKHHPRCLFFHPKPGRLPAASSASLLLTGSTALAWRLCESNSRRAGATVVIIAPHGGTISTEQDPVAVTKSALTTQSVEYDALVVAGGPAAEMLGQDPYAAANLGEAYRHSKTIAAWGQGRDVLKACGIALDALGVVTIDKPTRRFSASLIEAIGWHRHWTRV